MKAEEYQRLAHLLRDTKGLTRHERSFCRLILDRGGSLFATARKNAEDMGVSLGTYYRARDGVLTKGVVNEQRRYKATTIFTLLTDRLGGDLSTSRHSQQCETEGVLVISKTPTPTFSCPSLLAPDPSVWTTPDEGVEVCIDHGGGTTRKDQCQHCFNAASRARAESKHSDKQRRDWFENDVNAG